MGVPTIGRACRAWALPLTGLLAIACSSSPEGYPIATAYCNACGGRVYTANDCAGWAKQAGCLEYALDEPTLDRCTNACTFAHCKKDVIYLCGGAGSWRGFATCDDQVEGKWPTSTRRPPPGNPYSEISPNDGAASFFACRCAKGCPCDLVCGTIREADLPNDRYCVPPTP